MHLLGTLKNVDGLLLTGLMGGGNKGTESVPMYSMNGMLSFEGLTITWGIIFVKLYNGITNLRAVVYLQVPR